MNNYVCPPIPLSASSTAHTKNAERTNRKKIYLNAKSPDEYRNNLKLIEAVF